MAFARRLMVRGAHFELPDGDVYNCGLASSSHCEQGLRWREGKKWSDSVAFVEANSRKGHLI